MVEDDAASEPSGDDGARSTAAWRAWLSALARDAEAALAAAMTYGSLDARGRDAWLDALEADRVVVDAPAVALYAPLLAVESDTDRRARIERALGPSSTPPAATKALRAELSTGEIVCALVTPLYLEFVEMLVCRYRPDDGVSTAQHDPLRHVSQIDAAVALLLAEPLHLVPAPLGVVVEELAHAVVADRRNGRSSPPSLARWAHVFAPDLEDDEDRPSG